MARLLSRSDFLNVGVFKAFLTFSSHISLSAKFIDGMIVASFLAVFSVLGFAFFGGNL